MIKPILCMIAAMIIACYPKAGFAQAEINGGVNITLNDPAYSWGINNNFSFPFVAYSMNNFVANEEYKIVNVEDSPNLVSNLRTYIIKNYDQSSIFVPLGSGNQFTYQTNFDFYFSFELPATTPGQTQLLKFQIYRNRLGIWDWQSTFFCYVNTTCPGNYTFNTGTLTGIDYEIGGHMTVSTGVNPGSGITELDAGQSVTLLPNFSTSVFGTGSVLIAIDGCGGVYRMATTPDATTSAGQAAINVNELSVYPNPITNKCNIALPKDAIGKELLIQIMDINGRVLYSQNKTGDLINEVDMESFVPGLYFITITGNDIHFNKKVIKH
jgi:hypothetical protein